MIPYIHRVLDGLYSSLLSDSHLIFVTPLRRGWSHTVLEGTLNLVSIRTLFPRCFPRHPQIVRTMQETDRAGVWGWQTRSNAPQPRAGRVTGSQAFSLGLLPFPKMGSVPASQWVVIVRIRNDHKCLAHNRSRLIIIYALTYLTLIKSLELRYCTHFTSEKTKAERLYSLPQVEMRQRSAIQVCASKQVGRTWRQALACSPPPTVKVLPVPHFTIY